MIIRTAGGRKEIEMNENQISTYKEIIEQIIAKKNHNLNQIKWHKESAKECDKSIKLYEKKIRELEAR